MTQNWPWLMNYMPVWQIWNDHNTFTLDFQTFSIRKSTLCLIIMLFKRFWSGVLFSAVIRSCSQTNFASCLNAIHMNRMNEVRWIIKLWTILSLICTLTLWVDNLPSAAKFLKKHISNDHATRSCLNQSKRNNERI